MSLGFRELLSQGRLLLDEALGTTKAVFDDDSDRSESAGVSALEDRILMSATPLAPVTDAAAEGDASDASLDAESTDALAEFSQSAPGQQGDEAVDQSEQRRLEIIFVDAGVSDHDALRTLEGLRGVENVQFEIFELVADSDGLDQISSILGTRDEVDAVHLVSHGSDGTLRLGNAVVNQDNLGGYAAAIAGWHGALSNDADILIYGCELAESLHGQTLVESIGALTGADVAASDDLTGHASLGGDWELEFSVGDIESHAVYSATTQANWRGLLGALGDETLVNNDGEVGKQETSGDEHRSQRAVALDGSGNYVVVWSSDQDAAGWGVYAQRFDAAGNELTGELLVNEIESGDEQWARVAADVNGNFVVTWTSDHAGSNDVYARRFDSDGVALGGEFRVNTTTANTQQDSSIAMDGSGNFIVVWEGQGAVGSAEVFYRRFNADGSSIDAAEQRVNQIDSGTEQDASVAMNSSGEFVVVWENDGRIKFQMFDSAGIAGTGAEVYADTVSSAPDVGMDAAGNFVVTYRWDGGSGRGVWAHQFDNTGAESASWWRVGPGGFGANRDHTNPSIAMESGGDFIITYESVNQGGPGATVFAERFQADTTSLGRFQVNTDDVGDQHMASVAMMDVDNYVVAFTGTDANNSGIYTRSSFNTAPTDISPDALSIDENTDTSGGVSVAELTTTDSDGAEVFTYSIVGGSDSGNFSIGGAGDELIFAAGILDYETQMSYAVSVRVTDSAGNTYDETLTLKVNDLDDAPMINNQSMSIDENSANGTSVGTVAATDVDPAFGYTKLYWVDVDTDELRRINTDGSANELLASQSDGTDSTGTRGVAVDGVNGKVYWANNNFGEIWIADLDGGNSQRLLSGLDRPQEIAIDSVAAKLFWIEGSSNTIWHADLNGDNAGLLIGGLSNPKDVAVDSDAGKIYWTDAGSNQVNRADLDGSNQETIAGGLVDPWGIALDVDAGKVYWSDATANEIRRADMIVGATVETLVTGANEPRDLTLDVARGIIYWTAASSDRIESATLDGTPLPALTSTGDWPSGIAIGPEVADLTFAITSGNTSGAFAIDSNSGEITVANSGALDSETTPVFSLTVEVRDGLGLTADATVTVTVDDLNESPTAIASTSFNVDENTDTAGGRSLGALNTTDEDVAETFVYSIQGGADAGKFSIGGVGSDELVLTDGVLDFETQSSYSVVVRVTDSGLNTYDETLTVTVDDLNESPTAIASTSFTVNENTDTTGGLSLGALSTTDEDAAETFGYSIQGGADAGKFSIGGIGSDELVLSDGVLDFETQSSYTVVVRVTDSGLNTYDETITVTVDNLNESPTAIGPTSFTVNENTDTTSGLSLGMLNTTDEDVSETFAYSIQGGADAVKFTIGGVGSDELILTDGILDFETQSSYTVVVRVTDSGLHTYDETIMVTVDNLNDSPTAIVSTSFSVDENTDTTSGLSLGVLSTIDEDATETFTYSIQDGADAGKFSMGGVGSDELILTDGILDFETQSSYTVVVRVTDSGLNTYDETITVTVDNLNESPTGIASTSFSVDENIDTTGGLSLGVLSTTDEDSSETFAYSIQGGADAGKFTIGGAGSDELILTDSLLDFETQSSYTVVVRVTDSGLNTYDETITVTVDDFNESPTAIASTSFNVDENIDTTGGLSLGALSTTDEDSPEAFAYSIQGGADAGKFSIGGAGSDELILTDGVLDFETQSNYSVVVRVTDSGLNTYDETITVTVDDLNESPTAIASTSFNVAENTDTTAGLSLGALSTTDEDSPEAFAYSIQGGADAGKFSIGGAGSDELILTDGVLDFETQSSYSVVVRVTDSGLNTYDETITVTVNDVNTSPTLTVTPLFSGLDENTDTTSRIKVADIVIHDDALGINQLRLSGVDANRFKIVGNELFLKANTVLDHESQDRLDVTIGVRDVSLGPTNSDSSDLTLQVRDVNERPTLNLANRRVNIDENSDTTSRIKIADIVVQDDALGVNDLLIGGSDASQFEIIGSELYLRANTVLNHEADNALNVAVGVRDTSIGSGILDSQLVQLPVRDVNETPFVIGGNSVTMTEDGANLIVDMTTWFGDEDIDDSNLTFTVTGNTAAGTVQAAVNDVTNEIKFDQLPDKYGVSQITIQATDKDGLSVDKVIHVTVDPTNDTLQPQDQSFIVFDLSEPLLGDVLTATSDVDGESVVVQIVDGPSHGLLTMLPDGQFQFTPEAGFVGTDQFTFVVNDGVSVSSTAVAEILIEPLAIVTGATDAETSSNSDTGESTEDSSTEDVADAVLIAPTASDEDREEELDGTIDVRRRRAAGSPGGGPTASPSIDILLASETETRSESRSSSFMDQSRQAARSARARAIDFARAVGNGTAVGSEMLAVVMGPGALWSELDAFQDSVETDFDFDSMVVGSVGSVSSGLVVGYVVWAVRSGILMSSIVASMPAWSLIDPTTIISVADGSEEDGESLEEILMEQRKRVANQKEAGETV